MIKTSLLINHSEQTIFDYLVKMFTEQFKVSSNRLLNYTHHTTMKHGKSYIKVEQTITHLDVNKVVEFVTKYNNQEIKSTYWLESKDNQRTIVRLAEEGLSNKKTVDLNYKLFSLPILNYSAKKKLKNRLYQLNYALNQNSNGDVL